MASAFAAVIAAKFRYVGRAILAALLLGLLGGVIQRYVPPQSLWSTAATSSVPFAIIVGFLVYYISRGQAAESGAVGSAAGCSNCCAQFGRPRGRSSKGGVPGTDICG